MVDVTSSGVPQVRRLAEIFVSERGTAWYDWLVSGSEVIEFAEYVETLHDAATFVYGCSGVVLERIEFDWRRLAREQELAEELCRLLIFERLVLPGIAKNVLTQKAEELFYYFQRTGVDVIVIQE